MIDLEAIFEYDHATDQGGAVVVSSDPAGQNSGDPLAGTIFDGWVRRRDRWGRWGWEPAGLPESARWWNQTTFND
jgi:hypothetical protein